MKTNSSNRNLTAFTLGGGAVLLALPLLFSTTQAQENAPDPAPNVEATQSSTPTATPKPNCDPIVTGPNFDPITQTTTLTLYYPCTGKLVVTEPAKGGDPNYNINIPIGNGSVGAIGSGFNLPSQYQGTWPFGPVTGTVIYQPGKGAGFGLSGPLGGNGGNFNGGYGSGGHYYIGIGVGGTFG